jgi:hypothetical protein
LVLFFCILASFKVEKSLAREKKLRAELELELGSFFFKVKLLSLPRVSWLQQARQAEL